jgi:hypothetical protein
MDITSSPNLKPFRQFSDYEVINGLYAATTATLNKGTIVKITNAPGNTNVLDNQASPATPHLGDAGNWGEAPSYAYSRRRSVKWTVAAATTGDVALGMTIRDVAETNQFGENYAYRPRYEREEKAIVTSGEAVPILTRGIVHTNGFTGTPAPGSGASVSGGILVVGAYSKATSVGKWLSSADADGYAIFKLEL